jgi:outer membrane protein assembly factor BamB
MKKRMIGPIVLMLLIASALLPAQGNRISDTESGGNLLADDVEWWPMFHHDVQITGYTPSDSPDTNNKLWENQIDNDVWYSSPAIVDDKLVIGTGHRYYSAPGDLADALHFFDKELFMKDTTFLDIFQNENNPLRSEIGKLYCLNAKTGEILWEFEAEGSVFSCPTIDNGRVYFVSANSENYSGNLYCLDIDSKTEVWSLPVLTGFTTPTVQNGRIYLLTIEPETYKGKLLCLDATDGGEIWNHTAGYIDFSLYTALALADGKVFFTSVDVISGIFCKISCLNQSTGQLLWATKLSEMNFGYALSSPIIDHEKAYVISAQTEGVDDFWCMLTCLDMINGSMLWNYSMKEGTHFEISFGSPAVGYGNVYFASIDYDYMYGKLYCLNGENGTVQWVHKSMDLDMSSSPVLSSGKVFFGGLNMTMFDGNLYCLDASTGNLSYTAFVEKAFIHSTPAIADDALYVSSVTGKICAFKDPFKIGEIRGGLASVKLDITNVGDSDIEAVSYSMKVTGGFFHHINRQINGTIPVLEAQTTDTIKVFPIVGLGKLQVTVIIELDGLNPVLRTAEGFVFGIFVIIR